MDATQFTLSSDVSKPYSWNRSAISSRMATAQAIANAGGSQQKCADQVGVPRTTLQNWLRSRSQLELQAPWSTLEVQFFRITPRARVPTWTIGRTPFGLWAIS